MKSKILKNKLNIMLLCLLTSLAFVYTCNAATTGSDGDDDTTPDTTVPTVESSVPENNGLLTIDANITLTFSEDIQAGTGNIILAPQDGMSVTIPIADSQISISGKVLTINPSINLMPTTYTLTLPVGVIKDASNNQNKNVTRIFITQPPVTSISVGLSHSCAVAGGKAYCWGSDDNGQLGNGATITGEQVSPVAVLRGAQAAATPDETDLTNVTSISVGSSHTCAIAGGKAYCWGSDDNGRLGNGDTTGVQASPVMVGSLTDITSISVGLSHSCAIAGGKAYCWGNTGNGRLGNGATDNDEASPVAVVGVDGTGTLTNVTSISAGSSHSCAIAGGKAYCWGNTGNSQLGHGISADPFYEASPVAVLAVGEMAGGTALANVTSISAGGAHSCAVAGGKAYCWGNAGNGRLGNGVANHADIKKSPVAVLAVGGTGTLTDVTSILADNNHSCAVAGGLAYCWGDGVNGKLGNGATLGDQASPVAVLAVGGASMSTLADDVTSISASALHSCAIAGGLAYCWGRGGSGQLGNGADDNQASPVAVNAFPR